MRSLGFWISEDTWIETRHHYDTIGTPANVLGAHGGVV